MADPGPLPAAAGVELEGLGTETARQIGRFSAFLSRLVPAPEIDLDVVSGTPTRGGMRPVSSSRGAMRTAGAGPVRTTQPAG